MSCLVHCCYVSECSVNQVCSDGVHVSVTLCTCANGCVYLGKSVSEYYIVLGVPMSSVLVVN